MSMSAQPLKKRRGEYHASTNLQSIFPRETLLAVIAREGLDGQVDPLMTLQVVIPIEALRTLITFEGAVVGRSGLPVSRMMRGMATIHMLHIRQVATVVPREKARLEIAHERHLPARVVDIGHDGPVHGGKRVRRPRTSIAQLRWLHGRRLARSRWHPRRVDSQAALCHRGRSRIRRRIRAGRRGVLRRPVHGS